MFRQSWNRLTFLHWRFDAGVVKPYLPPGLAVDTCDGSAWVSMTPFLLGLKWMSPFPETNLRTYVKGPDGPGIWFFSLDAYRLAAVIGARASFGLPYQWADMTVDQTGDVMQYAGVRRKPFRRGGYRVSVRIGEPIVPGELDLFLAERYRLYTTLAGRLAYARVEHTPWELRRAEVVGLEQSLTDAAGLPEPGPVAIAQFSDEMGVRVGRPRFV